MVLSLVSLNEQQLLFFCFFKDGNIIARLLTLAVVSSTHTPHRGNAEAITWNPPPLQKRNPPTSWPPPCVTARRRKGHEPGCGAGKLILGSHRRVGGGGGCFSPGTINLALPLPGKRFPNTATSSGATAHNVNDFSKKDRRCSVRECSPCTMPDSRREPRLRAFQPPDGPPMALVQKHPLTVRP